MVVCAYVDMLNLESHIKDHQFFRQAAEIAIEIYLHLFDYPLSQNPTLQSDQSGTKTKSTLSPFSFSAS